MDLNIIGARLLTKEEASNLPVTLRKAGKTYWVKPEAEGQTCPYVDSYGDIYEGSIYDECYIRPVIILKSEVSGEQYEETAYSGSEWYILSSHELLSKEVVERTYRFEFDKGSSNNFEEREIKSWIDITYKTFRRQDIVSFTDNYVFPDGVTVIGDKEFEGDSRLKKIVIPDSVERIGNSAFLGCTSIETVVLGEGLKSGGSNVFRYCKNIKEVHVKNIESILNYCCDNYGSPLQYGADLYVNGIRCTNVDIPENAKHRDLIMPLIGCGSVESISVSKDAPCFDEIKKLVEDLNNGGEKERFFTDGPIRKWALIIK